MLEKHTLLEIQRFHRHLQMLRSEWLYRPHRIPRFISNKINWTNNCYIIISSYYRCASRTEHRNKLAIQLHQLAPINLRIWKNESPKSKTIFELQRHSSTQSMRRRYDTVYCSLASFNLPLSAEIEAILDFYIYIFRFHAVPCRALWWRICVWCVCANGWARSSISSKRSRIRKFTG